ncbi:hypothetical protein D3C84_1023270 [compost metagenome]
MLCFVKKLTVIGIIGNTQGVNNAANPDKKARKKIDHKLIEEVESGTLDFVSFFAISVLADTILVFSAEDFNVSTAIPVTLVSSNFASVTAGTASILKVAGTAIENFLFELMQTSLQT